MIYTIDNYKDLETKFLELNDRVVFEVNDTRVVYETREKWLTIIDWTPECIGVSESEIFKILNIENHINFCSTYYGYSAREVPVTTWPDCKPFDYAALTRVIIALFDIIFGKTEISKLKKLELTSVNIAFL
jgi:hypothetical protein